MRKDIKYLSRCLWPSKVQMDYKDLNAKSCIFICFGITMALKLKTIDDLANIKFWYFIFGINKSMKYRKLKEKEQIWENVYNIIGK